MNIANNPAAPGTIVSVFANGFGTFSPAPTDGTILNGALPTLVSPQEVQVLHPGEPLEATYAGPAPGLVAGVIQVNFRLPASTGTDPEFQFLVT